MNKYLSLLKDCKLDEAEQYRKESVPKKLIKFFSLSDDHDLNRMKLQTLENEEIWISSIDALNDPYEFSCMYVDRKRLHEAKWPERLIAQFEHLIGPGLRTWGVASLSANTFDCFPMWAYYANNHYGYCVEYEVLRPDNIHEIFYEPNRISLATMLTNFYYAFAAMVASGREDDPKVDFYATVIKQQLFLKHISWAHEKEYRVVFNLYGQPGQSIPLDAVGLKTSRIIAGNKCSEEHLLALQEISSKIGCGKVDQAQISATDYVLL